MADTFLNWNSMPGRELMPGLTAWASTGESLQLVKSVLAPGVAFAPHAHPHEQLLVVLSGTFECTVGGQIVRSGADGVFQFAPHLPHGGAVVGSEPAVIIEAFHPPRLDYTSQTQHADHDEPR